MNEVNQFLLRHNAQQTALYTSPDAVAQRRYYSHEHRSPIMVMKCMDGRVNVPPMTDGRVPMGIISPFRTMGGKFEIGSPNFTHFVRNYYEYVEERMQAVAAPGGFVFTTYHFSEGDTHRGCKGFGFDTDAARAFTANLKREYDEVYGISHVVVHPIHMGIETDREAFIFHGDDDEAILDMRFAFEDTPAALASKLQSLYPGMRDEMLADLMPLVLGNQSHVRKVIASGKEPAALEHKEDIIGVGRGFDWLHLINRALIVGPFSIDWLSEVVVAATIVLDNLKSGRVNRDNGAVLLVSAPHRTMGVDEMAARKKALKMAQASWSAITGDPVARELLSCKLEPVVGTLDRSTMRFNRIGFTPG